MFIDERIEVFDEYIRGCLEDGTFPGCVYSLIDKDKSLIKNFGFAQIEPSKREMKKDTIFDIASLTKVVATTTAMMMLLEDGKIQLKTKVKDIIEGYPFGNVTIKHIMTHTAGYPPEPDYRACQDRESLIDRLLKTKSIDGVFEKSVVYSDTGFMILGLIIDKLTGSFEEFANKRIFEPLEMNNTCFKPDRSDLSKFAATEMCPMRKEIVIGAVHDEKAHLMGGVAGHAGVFSTAQDLSKFAMMILNDGMYKGKYILSKKTIELMSKCYTPDMDETRGLGWVTKGKYNSMGDLSSDKAIFHAGFTGTSLLIDRKYNTAVILLTNRVHPTRENIKLVLKRCNMNSLALTCTREG